MKLNQDKCQLLVSRYKNDFVWAHIGNEKLWESNKEKSWISSITYPLCVEKRKQANCYSMTVKFYEF